MAGRRPKRKPNLTSKAGPKDSSARVLEPPPPSAPPRLTTKRRYVLVGGLAIGIAAAGVAAGLVAGNSAGGSGLADQAAPRPSYYRIVYKVVDSASGSPIDTWEVVTSSGPFDVADLSYHGPPSSGAPFSGTVTTFDGLYDLNSGQLEYVSDRQPGLGSGAEAMGSELVELVARHLATPAHQSMVVVGRRCVVVRFAEPPAGAVKPLSGSDHDDLCIDASGLLLSERWTLSGRVVMTRTAISVELSPGGESFVGAPPLSSAKPLGLGAAGTLLRVTKGAGKSFLAVPPAPAGFSAQTAVETVAFDPTHPGSVTDSSTIWSFGRAGDVMTVEAGEGALPWAGDNTVTRTVHLAFLGTAASALRSDGPEIEVQLSGARWLRVRGTVPLSTLTAYASELRL